MYRYAIKSLIDSLVAIILLVLFSPIILITYLLLQFVNRGDVFFLQKRPGYKEMPFNIIKFKTMRDDKNEHGELLPDSQRTTFVGGWIRKLSIDELPQLINVIKGDMSLVGPRPLLFKYIPLYSVEQRKRHSVKPGITGLAQINGRNSISWTKKFELDTYYTEHLSFRLDLQILWLTIIKVIKREGVNQSAERPMMPFDGRN
ncbi:sugar transferase [Pedobacter sp. ASV28]|uniref:sugar transferase n=1 Tax=Pedobacter sp. ASV28 TaxID=2795123 RepID=UPI0018EDFFC2|nr:sugar transferase [Pedobacter sp. ASV28]